MAAKAKLKAKSKLELAVELLETERGAKLSNVEAAAEIDCSEAHIRRARAIIAARQKIHERSDNPDEAARLLADITSACEAEELIETTIADLKVEAKFLKGELKSATQQRRRASKAPRESHPLFDGVKAKAEENGESGNGQSGKSRRTPTLAAVG